MMNPTSNQLITTPGNLTELSANLKSLAPIGNETAQLITYALITTAVVGIFVYQYIKSQEQDN